MPTLNDIEEAAKRLQGHLLDTPCVESRTLSQITSARIFLKFENLQYTASFKERGACNKLAQLSEDERRRGVIAMSAWQPYAGRGLSRRTAGRARSHCHAALHAGCKDRAHTQLWRRDRAAR